MLFENRSIERVREREGEVFETESRKDLRAMTNAMKTEQKKMEREERFNEEGFWRRSSSLRRSSMKRFGPAPFRLISDNGWSAEKRGNRGSVSKGWTNRDESIRILVPALLFPRQSTRSSHVDYRLKGIFPFESDTQTPDRPACIHRHRGRFVLVLALVWVWATVINGDDG